VRVLHLIKGLGLGGAERLLEMAAPYLDREHFDYHVAYLLPWKDALAGPLRDAGIPVHCLEYRRLADLAVLSRLVRLVQRERIELIHAHLPVAGLLARLAKRRTGVRVVYTEHGVPGHYRWPTRIANALTYRLNDAVIAVSGDVARSVAGYVRGGRPRLVTVPNAVEERLFTHGPADAAAVRRAFGVPPGAPLVVTVGNLRAAKGHADLLQAARRVRADRPGVRFLIVGVGPREASLRRQAAQLALDGTVVLTGFRSDARDLIAVADLYVLPSRSEGLPVSLLEAMALGRPVVATHVGGIPEVLRHGVEGLLVPPADPEALAEAILALLADPDRRERLGAAARAGARGRFSMTAMTRAVELVYRQVGAAA
jgi:glycosyltransferase involved in cell wall biosynthesis